MVAIDGSEHSLKAAEYALELAKSFNAQLFAITVTSVPESYHLTQEDGLIYLASFLSFATTALVIGAIVILLFVE